MALVTSKGNQIAEDWQKVDLNLGYEHNALSSSGDLMIKKIGNIVFIKGSVKGFSGAGETCAILPEKYRPKSRIDTFFGTGGNYFAKGMIAANGGITLLGDSRGSFSVSNWYSICTSWLTD